MMSNNRKYQSVKKCTELTLFISRLKKQLQIGGPVNEENAEFAINVLHQFMNGEFVTQCAEFIWNKTEVKK